MNFLKKIILFSAFVIFSIILLISFISLRKLVFKSDPFVNGERLSVVAQGRRNKLMQKYQIEEVFINSTDNIKLVGFLIRREKPKGNVILCHGFQRSKEFMVPFIDVFEDYNVLMFDFRAQGQSSGNLITLGINEAYDVIAATAFVKSKLGSLPLIILGVSMGASATIRAASIKPDLCNVIISDSAFRDLGGAIRKSFTQHAGLPNFPFVFFITLMAKWFYNYDVSKMNPIENVKNFNIPIFFIHSCIDTIVPTKHTLGLYAEVYELGNKTDLWITPPAIHAGSVNRYSKLYKEKVMTFLSYNS